MLKGTILEWRETGQQEQLNECRLLFTQKKGVCLVEFTSNVIQPSDTATAMIKALFNLRYISSFAVIRFACKH